MLEEGFLKVSNIHKIYYSTHGNKKGIPLLFIHGGPGGCSNVEKQLEGIDLNKFYTITFDQRGSGKSVPLGEIKENTTQELIEDIKKLLEYLKVEKTIITGSSWGACLALLFAEIYPEKVLKMYLRSSFLARKKDSEWLFKGSKEIFPDVYDKYMSLIPKDEKNPSKYLFEKLENGSVEEKQKITLSIMNYENVLMLMVFSSGNFLTKDKIDENFIASTRLFLHYESNHFFIEDNYILNNCKKLDNIPIIFFHGRFDMDSPLGGVYELHKKLNNSELTIIPYESHRGILSTELMKKSINLS